MPDAPDEAFDRSSADPEALGDVALQALSGFEGSENALAEIHGKRGWTWQWPVE